jgi:hypothetical protein
MEKHAVPVELQFVQIPANPSAGLVMAFRCPKVIRGSNAAFVIDFTSGMAELSGVEASVLMATWALAIMLKAREKRKNRFFIELSYY